MVDPTARCGWRRAWPSRSRTQAAAFAGRQRQGPGRSDAQYARHASRPAWSWNQPSNSAGCGWALRRIAPQSSTTPF